MRFKRDNIVMKRACMFVFWVLILLATIACSGLSGTPPANNASATPSAASSSPSATTMSGTANIVQDYYQAIQTHNYAKAYSYVWSNATTTDGQKLTLATLKRLATMTENAEGPIQTFSVAAFPSEVVMTITRQRLGPYHSHLHLKPVGNTWKIVSIDRI